MYIELICKTSNSYLENCCTLYNLQYNPYIIKNKITIQVKCPSRIYVQMIYKCSTNHQLPNLKSVGEDIRIETARPPFSTFK